MGRRAKWTLAGALGAAVLLCTAAGGGQTDACARCQPRRAYWDWKANGYALGSTEEQATEAARGHARTEACTASEPYLNAHQLRCKPGCRSGLEQRRCRVRGKSKCLHGRREHSHGMWRFVCRKVFGKAALHGACDAARATEQPAFAMCDVSTRAMKELACGTPDCGTRDHPNTSATDR